MMSKCMAYMHALYLVELIITGQPQCAKERSTISGQFQYSLNPRSARIFKTMTELLFSTAIFFGHTRTIIR